MAVKVPLVRDSTTNLAIELSASDTISKTSVGLGNVDNTSDVNKPVSTAQQAAIDTKMNDTSVAALAESNATQSITSGTFQKVLLASEVYDSGFYDPATSRFTPTKAGKYVAIGAISFTPTVASGLRLVAAATKNGTISANTTSATHNQTTNTIQHVAIYDMNGTTDYLELYARQDTGSSMNITGVNNTNMVVYRIGA